MSRESIVLSICNYIDSNITKSIKIDDIANHFHFDRYYLMKIFKKEMGITIIEYINSRRIQNSLPPLVNTDEKILKIALTSGFNSLEYYSEEFTKIVGINPSSFRKLASTYNITSRLGGNMNKTLEDLQTNIERLKGLKAEIIKFTVVESKDKENKVSLEKEKVKTLIPKRNLQKAS